MADVTHPQDSKKGFPAAPGWHFLFLGGGFKHFSCSSLLGEMIQFDEHIFQMGWFNHQLGFLWWNFSGFLGWEKNPLNYDSCKPRSWNSQHPKGVFFLYLKHWCKVLRGLGREFGVFGFQTYDERIFDADLSEVHVGYVYIYIYKCMSFVVQ